MEPKDPSRTTPSQFAGRVLVADDNLTNRKVIEALLIKLGLAVVLVEDGQQCMGVVTQGDTTDLILMDPQMPTLDGYATTMQIRHWEDEKSRPRHPIIALTADAFEEHRQQCLAAGMDDFLTKPIAMDQLTQVLGRWLKRVSGPQLETPQAIATQKFADTSLVVALAREILPMLAQHQFDAIGRLKELQRMLAGTELEGDVAEAGHLLEEFHFDQAHNKLHDLFDAQGWSDAL
jgi:CheY-like chemotaxis protein